MNEQNPTRIVDCRCHIGEGPLWHPDEERLYWVDISKGFLYRYNPVQAKYEQCYETNVIGGFTIQADGSLLLFEGGGRIERWHDDATETVVDRIKDEAESRFNDVIADPHGRVFCGTMPTDDQSGSLYRVEIDGTVTHLFDGLDIPNGMGFSSSVDTLYVTESEPGRIYSFAYDESTGELSNRDVFLDIGNETGVPDGLTVDEEGCVWSARWNGGCLVRYAPDGTELRRIEFPARKVSSVTFGGEQYDRAYVTTALGPGEGTAGERDAEGDGAGAVFAFRPGTTGVPEYRSRIEI
jgi:D-xylonolactonase